MTTRSIPSILLISAGVATLVFAGCSKGDREELKDDTKAAYADAKASVAKGWENVKDFTFEQRDEFTAEFKAKQAQVDASLSELKSEYSEAKASASRKAAMAEVKDSESNYKEKLAALGRASADTWDAARDDVVAAWDDLQASIAKARAND